MSALHQSLEREGVALDLLESADGRLRLEVARQGAEMISLQARNPATGSFEGFLYRDGATQPPEDGWGNHATVMGYFIHRLWGEQSAYAGQPIRGGNHGFIRHLNFPAPEFDSEQAALIYRISPDMIPPEAYPLRVGLRLSYQLTEQGLRVEFLFTNEEPDKTAKLSFGLHPGFAVSSVEQARILLPAGKYIRHMAPGNFLNGKTKVIDHVGGPMPFDKSKLPDSYLLGLENLDDRKFRIEDPVRGTAVDLDFSECPYLTIWSDLNPFVCLEPCWGMPDSNPPLPFEKKTGIQSIPPLGTLTKSFGIHPWFSSK